MSIKMYKFRTVQSWMKVVHVLSGQTANVEMLSVQLKKKQKKTSHLFQWQTWVLCKQAAREEKCACVPVQFKCLSDWWRAAWRGEDLCLAVFSDRSCRALCRRIRAVLRCMTSQTCWSPSRPNVWWPAACTKGWKPFRIWLVIVRFEIAWTLVGREWWWPVSRWRAAPRRSTIYCPRQPGAPSGHLVHWHILVL